MKIGLFPKAIYVVIREGLDNEWQVCAAFYKEENADEYVETTTEGWSSEAHYYRVIETRVYDA